MSTNLAESLDRVVKSGKPIEPLLRPHQEVELADEIGRVERQMEAPEKVRARMDMGQQRKERMRLRADRDRLTPQPFQGQELDAAVKLEKDLRETITTGMLTQEDMRRNTAGAVDRHRAWERRNKRPLDVWKNLRLRLRKSGVNFGDLENDIANIEIYRPSSRALSGDLSTAQIVRPDYHMPAVVTPITVLSDAEEAWMKANAPALYQAIGLMGNEARADVMAEVRKLMAAPAPAPRAQRQAEAAKPTRRPMSEEAKAKARERLREIHERRRAAKQASE